MYLFVMRLDMIHIVIYLLIQIWKILTKIQLNCLFNFTIYKAVYHNESCCYPFDLTFQRKFL